MEKLIGKKKSIIDFYMLAMKLKTKLRNGWLEINIQCERIESVAEHVYGTLILALAMDSEYALDLDMFKVLKMLVLHELEEIIIPDYTLNSDVTREQKLIEGKKAVHKVTEGLIKQDEIESLLDEFNAHKTKESLFAFHIDKMECDLTGKKYDLDGMMNFDDVKKDVQKSPDCETIIKNAKNPSDIWVEVDRHHYTNSIFMEFLDEVKNYENNER